MGKFYLDTHTAYEFIISLSLSLRLSLSAVLGHAVACRDRQNSLLASSAVGTQDGNAERLRLHGSTAHALLLHSTRLQGEHGLTATFALMDRWTDGWIDSRGWETQRVGWRGTVL